jgi:hypothetical protein
MIMGWKPTSRWTPWLEALFSEQLRTLMLVSNGSTNSEKNGIMSKHPFSDSLQSFCEHQSMGAQLLIEDASSLEVEYPGRTDVLFNGMPRQNPQWDYEKLTAFREKAPAQVDSYRCDCVSSITVAL